MVFFWFLCVGGRGGSFSLSFLHSISRGSFGQLYLLNNTSCYTLPRYYFNNLKCNEGVREFSMGASYTRDPHWIELLNSIKNMSTEIKIFLPNICNHNYFHLTHCTAALHSYMLSQKDNSSEILTKLICLYFFRFWSSNQLVSMVQERNTFTSCLREHLCCVVKERNLSISIQNWIGDVIEKPINPR